MSDFGGGKARIPSEDIYTAAIPVPKIHVTRNIERSHKVIILLASLFTYGEWVDYVVFRQ